MILTMPGSVIEVLLIALGGAVGSMARYGLALTADGRLGHPWGTAVVNVLGCFAIGLLAVYATADRPWLKPLLLIGFLGGFTTFSAFALHTLELAHAGAWIRATAYAGISVIGCLIAVLAGAATSHLLAAR
jgi:fluoride exporter